MYRTKRSQTVVTEGIFELPNLTIQATRAQTVLLQAIYQSWSHIGNAASSTVNEALMSEAFQTPGKSSLALLRRTVCFRGSRYLNPCV